jgi:hypothetical protein
MIKKKENCEYCGEKMESITAKKRFCSEKCRVYFSRTKSVLKNEPQKLAIGSKIESKKQMPKGLSIEERIKWLEENEKL